MVPQEVTYKETLKEAEKAKEVANKRLHEAGQTYAELLGQTMPRRVEIAELKDAAEDSKIRTKNLEDRCVSQEVNLGKAEAALTAKTKACDLLKTDYSNLQKERDELSKQLAEKTEALVAKEKEMASRADHFEKTEKDLVDEAADAFAEGFTEALAQVACEHPGVDTSNCGPLNHIVEGKIVPLDLFED